MAEEPKDPNEEHDRKTSTTPDAPKISEADAWGTSLNPLRETPLAATNLRQGGSSK